MSEDVRDMSDNAIMDEFEELFGTGDIEDEGADDNEGTGDTSTDDENDDESSEDESDDESGTDDEDTDGDDDSEEGEGDGSNKERDARAKQNYAFAELRTKVKRQEALIKNLGKVIGLDSNTPIETVASKVEELITRKEAKDANVPEELYTRLKQLESIAQESEKVKREKDVSDAFMSLSEKYELTSDEIVEFAGALAENGRNPLEVEGVDIEAEYLKLHQQDMIEKAVQAALNAEVERKKKVEDHASSSSTSSRDADGEGGEIKSVSDLDKMFSEIDL
jgi:hypothetical protein